MPMAMDDDAVLEPEPKAKARPAAPPPPPAAAAPAPAPSPAPARPAPKTYAASPPAQTRANEGPRGGASAGAMAERDQGLDRVQAQESSRTQQQQQPAKREAQAPRQQAPSEKAA